MPIYLCNYLEWMRNNQTTAGFTKFTDYIEYQISHDHYIEACLDRYYLSCSGEYQKIHNIHTTFIYGFDQESKEIYISDFYQKKKYDRYVVSYDEINRSIEGINYIINLYMLEDVNNYKTNFKLMNRFLKDYINCQDSFGMFDYSNCMFNKDILYGLDYYDYLINHELLNQKIDLRYYHVLYDHKTIMKIRLDYLSNLNLVDKDEITNLIDLNNNILESTKLLEMLALKYEYSKSDKVLNKLIKSCQEIKNLDYELCKRLIDYTEKCSLTEESQGSYTRL